VTDLTKLPIVDLRTPQQKEQDQRDLGARLVREGENSYWLGLDKCPPFRDPDMEVSWGIGWRRAHVEHYNSDNRYLAQRRCLPDCRHEKDLQGS
jgi:hypothetical protein